jgi:predicted PurR-regulated permease PerM
MLKSLAGVTWRIIVLGFAFYLLIQAIGLVFPVAFALFLALFTTALADPVARLLGRLLPRVLSVVLALLLILSAGVFLMVRVIGSIVNEGDQLSAAVSAGIGQIQDWLENGPLQLTTDQFNSLQSQAENWLEQTGQDAVATIASDLGALGVVITAGSVYIFGTIFFLTAGGTIWQWVVGWIPLRARTAFDVCGHLAWRTMAGYTRGVVVVALFDALLVFIGLTVLQVPLAPVLAAVVFMGAFIPVIGAPIATLLAAIVALATKGPTTAILVVALTIVVGSFDGDVMQPLVMGKTVQLHPLAIVTIIAAGALTLGIVGALIAIPVASSFYAVAKYLAGRDPDNPFPHPGRDGPPDPPSEPAAESEAREAADG